MYTEVSGKFITKSKSLSEKESMNTPKKRDIVVQKLNKHIVLCLHWECLMGNEKETYQVGRAPLAVTLLNEDTAIQPVISTLGAEKLPVSEACIERCVGSSRHGVSQ